jgi:O-methyltransferase involved in polyketide biosynthesis
MANQPNTSTKQSVQTLKGVAETLMITVYGRYAETQRSDALLQDPEVERIVERVDYDFSKYQKGWASQLGVVIRVREIDRLVTAFLAENPQATVINLGCGLCTRFSRLQHQGVNLAASRWYEVDFPEVIVLRDQILPSSGHHYHVTSSVLASDWIEQILADQDSMAAPRLILAEGLTMYLSAAQNQQLFGMIHDRLAPVTLIFDVLNQKVARNSHHHDTVSKTDAVFQWGIDRGVELENWNLGLKLQQEVFYLRQFNDYPDRLPTFARLIRPILARLFQNSGRILQMSINP